MPLPYALQQMIRRPEMYFTPLGFDVGVAFLQGFDLACNGGVLLGFREWLIVRLGSGNNLAWSELVLRCTFPDAENPSQRLLQPGGQQHAVALLFGLLEEFYQERDTPQGLRRIYLRYQRWLQDQEWYGSSSPDYLADP
jgi:hypothetical protein